MKFDLATKFWHKQYEGVPSWLRMVDIHTEKECEKRNTDHILLTLHKYDADQASVFIHFDQQRRAVCAMGSAFIKLCIGSDLDPLKVMCDLLADKKQVEKLMKRK